MQVFINLHIYNNNYISCKFGIFVLNYVNCILHAMMLEYKR